MRASLKDLAAHLGLSCSTISRALHHHPRIPRKTRERVQAAAEELGYRPNALMSEIASSHWQEAKVVKGIVIAYIDRLRSRGPLVAPPYVLSGLSEQAALLGYQLEVFRREEFSSSAKLERVLHSRGITDVILGAVFEEELTVELDWSKFICVQFLAGRFQLPLHSVAKDDFNSVVMAWQKAVAYGYRRIGAVLWAHSVEALMDDVLRASAVHACQKELFPTHPAIRPLRLREGEPGHMEQFTKWVKVHQPDMILGVFDGPYHLYRTAFGREIPFISLHTTPPNGPSGIISAELGCAREGVNLLHFCRRTHQWGIPKQRIDHVIEPTWFEGATLPKKEPSSPLARFH